ncbi:MAG TPA: multiheme c-type cytochrome [Planctomycetota bacterium]|jgi:hypothetical protein|nr:multiheme c-type cytochrome [Planctomycetota bacterium]
MTLISTRSPRLALGALAALIVSGIALSAARLLTGLPIPTTPADFHQPGTQPLSLNQTIQSSVNCEVCHGGFDVNQEPYTRWSASMMAQATRDPVVHAGLAIANQDMAGSGEMCLRCHAPGAWLDGRSTPPDGSALDNLLGDFDGVTCHLCHRMVDPFYEQGVSPQIDRRILQQLAQIPFSIGNGEYVIDPDDVRRGPFDLGPNFFLHDWLQSPFHREALLCANCHEVSNPATTKQPDGSYALNALNTEHPTHDKRDEFPIERTYSEWSKSVYAQAPIDTNGRFGGNALTVSTCQDCHMPDTHGTACQPVLGGAIRDDLPLHDFNGTNSWVLDAVRNLYPDSETGLTTQSVADAHARNLSMTQRGLDLDLFTANGLLGVRLINQTGHKLPTGYGEGRRLWINVKFYDASNVLLAERGAYDSGTATLTTTDTKVIEAVQGLDAAMAATTGLPAGPSFHFVLNNTVVKDNRIPPRGFSNPAFASVQTEPVGASFPEQHYWDDTIYTPPPAAVRADVSVYQQTTSREYIEFLMNTNTTNTAGVTAYNQWVATGMSAPVLMQSASIDLIAGECPLPVPLGVSKQLAAGGYPSLTYTGTPTITAHNFAVVVHNAKPNVLGVLFQSPTTATTPFVGATFYLAAPYQRVGNFTLDGTGSISVPISVTPGMEGTERQYQFVFRDLYAPQSLGVTNGLHVEFCL